MSFLGITFAVVGLGLAVVLVCTGAALFSLGVMAEYVGVAVNMAFGKPALHYGWVRPVGLTP